MKKGIFFFFIFCSISTIAQVKFRGIITEQNSGNKPIALANVKADFANPIQSDSKGLFNLTFQGKNLGDEISINAQKEGFEVVNFKEMLTKIPKKQVTPFKIIMCKAGLVAQNRAKYYGISEKHITAKYEKELAKLNRNIAGWEEKAAKLEEDFRASLEFAKELAERYSLMNLDDVTELQRKAFKLFEENKVEEAIRILEGENYQENIRKVKLEQKKIQENTQLADEEIAKVEEVIQQQISKLMFQADLYAQDFQFDKAERTYEIAVKADYNNFNNILTFSSFLSEQNSYQKAIKYNFKALNISTFDLQNIVLNNAIGLLYIETNQKDSALFYLKNAEKIAIRLQNKPEYISTNIISQTFKSLGFLYGHTGDIQLATNYLSKAIQLSEKLLKKDVISNITFHFENLKTFAELIEEAGSYEGSVQYYSTIENLIQFQRENNLESVSDLFEFNLHNHQINCYLNLEQFDKVQYYLEIIQNQFINKYKQNPKKYIYEFIYFKLLYCSYLLKLNLKNDAIKELNSLKSIIDDTKSTVLKFVELKFNFHKLMGAFYSKSGNLNEMNYHYNICIELSKTRYSDMKRGQQNINIYFEKIAFYLDNQLLNEIPPLLGFVAKENSTILKLNSRYFRYNAARLTFINGLINNHLNNFSVALIEFNKTLDYYNSLINTKLDGEKIPLKIGYTKLAIGDSYYGLNKNNEALRNYTEGEKIFLTNTKPNEINHLDFLASKYNIIAGIYFNLGNSYKAIETQSKAVKIYQDALDNKYLEYTNKLHYAKFLSITLLLITEANEQKDISQRVYQLNLLKSEVEKDKYKNELGSITIYKIDELIKSLN